MPSIDDAPPRPQPRRPSPGTQLPAPARPPLPASVVRGTFWNPISGNCSDASPVLGPLAPQRLRLRKPRCGCCGTPTSLPRAPWKVRRTWVPSAPDLGAFRPGTGYGLRAPGSPGSQPGAACLAAPRRRLPLHAQRPSR